MHAPRTLRVCRTRRAGDHLDGAGRIAGVLRGESRVVFRSAKGDVTLTPTRVPARRLVGTFPNNRPNPLAALRPAASSVGIADDDYDIQIPMRSEHREVVGQIGRLRPGNLRSCVLSRLASNISMSAAVRQIRSAGIHGLWVASKISSPEKWRPPFFSPSGAKKSADIRASRSMACRLVALAPVTEKWRFLPSKKRHSPPFFPCLFRVPASLGPGLRTASGANARRGGPGHRAMMSTMSKEERTSLQSELAAALAAGQSCAEWASANGVPERTAQALGQRSRGPSRARGAPPRQPRPGHQPNVPSGDLGD